MNFRDRATTELTAVVDRLTAAADASAQAAAATAAAAARSAADTAASTARAAADAAATAAQAAIDKLKAEKQGVERALQEETRAKTALEQARAGLEKARAALDKSRGALEKERDSLRKSLEAARTEASDTRRDLQAKVDAAHAETVTARSEVKDTLDAARAESAKTVSDLQSQVEAARAETAKSRRDFQVKLDAAVRASAEATTRANEWRQDQARAMREQAVTFVSRSLDRLLAVSASFAGVSTADDVWAAMVAALGTEFSRVALFKVADGQLQGLLRHVGFKFPGNAAHVGVPYPIDSVLDRSITSGQIETVTADALEPTAGTAFGGTPACGLALPIELDGEVCAVLYADDSDQPHRAFGNVELRRKFADLLRQQAAPLLMRLPTELKAVAEFREYAARLVAELENMYAADVNARKKGEDLRRRLKDNVECARGIYAQRVSAEAPSAADLIEEELALAVAAQRATAYGRDLTAVLGASDSARRTQAARASVEA